MLSKPLLAVMFANIHWPKRAHVDLRHKVPGAYTSTERKEAIEAINMPQRPNIHGRALFWALKGKDSEHSWQGSVQ